MSKYSRRDPVRPGLTLWSNFHLDLRVVHARIHVRHIVNAAIATMENPSFAAVRDLELLVRDAGLLVTILAVRANESHVFVVDTVTLMSN
jgi:hypothetical protein